MENPERAAARLTPPPGYRTQSEDTSYAAERFLFEAYRRMPPWEKADRLSAVSRFAQELSLIGLRQRYPGASVEELRLRLAAFRLGRETMIRLMGWDPDRKGA